MIDIEQAKYFLTRHVIPTASSLLKKYFYEGHFSIKQKQGVDFTTQADEEVNSFIVNKLKEKFPQSEFLAEETAPPSYKGFELKKNLWIIDPLDGTTNFSHKNSNFAISIALVNEGKTQLAVAHRPISDETFIADVNHDGTFLNGKPIKVSKIGELKKAVIACDWSWDLEKRKIIVDFIGNLIQTTRQIKIMGSAVSDICSLACGQIDGYAHSGPKPWDIAAASLILTKAGGKITTLKGDEWSVFTPGTLATNGLLHKEIEKLIM